MSISYKTLWQEADQEVQRLRAEVDQLHKALMAHPDEARREWMRIRQVVDLAGIARHMKVERFTPQQWRQRGLLPPVDFPEIKEPLWYVSTIKEQFIVPTRRVWYDAPPPEELSPAA